MSTVTGDTPAALDFIARFAALTGRPTICLASIMDDAPDAHTFDVTDMARMRAWIDARQGKRNIYFEANHVTGHPTKKPDKTGIARADTVWTDLDPAGDAKTFAAERLRIEAVAADLLMSDAPPSIVIDSGGGYQLFWVLQSPLPLHCTATASTKTGKVTVELCDNTKLVEALGARFERRFGADKVRNVDRIMRLPGTVNVPDKKKKAKGRQPALARLLSLTDNRYSLEELRALTCWNLDGLDFITLDGDLRSKLLRALATNDTLHARWLGEKPAGDQTRSGFSMSIGAILKGLGFDKAEVLTILNVCPYTASEKVDERAVDRIFENSDVEEGGLTAKRPQRDRLLDFRHEIELWHNPAKDGFATINRDGHSEHHRIRSKEFRGWLVAKFMEQARAAPSSQALSEALSGFEAFAYQGLERDPRIRTAEHNDKIYLDLGRPQWDAVEIDAGGWRIVPRAPVPMLRPQGMLSLPEPVRGGKIAELRKFTNVATDEDFSLLVGFLLAVLRPCGPYPILNPVGEGGSAKTTLSRVVRALTDPNVASVTSSPHSEIDLQVDAANGHLLAYDNISHVSAETADMFCRLATGAGLGKRALYTDADRHVLYACRPMILNGISDMAHRDDLSQRTISMLLPAIPDAQRKSEREFQCEFDAAAPRILGALLDGVSHAIRHLPEVKAHPPRLADFTLWVMAAIGAYGWDPEAFLDVMRVYRETAARKTAEGDAVARTVRAFMSGKDEWHGTLTELLDAFGHVWNAFEAPSDKNWPTDTTRLSSRLRRAAPALRVLGIDVTISDRSGHENKRVVTIQRLAAARDEQAAA